jgi:hypothetical protein
MAFGLGPLSDLPAPRRGEDILPLVAELCRRANRRIEGTCVRQGPSGVWIDSPLAFPPVVQLIPFEMYDDIYPGQTDRLIWPLKDDYTRDDSTSPPTVKVRDGILGNVRAYGSNHGWSATTRGAIGLYMPGTDGNNQIVYIKRLSKSCSALTYGGAVSGGTFSVNTVYPLDDGQRPVAIDSDVLTVSNWAGWSTTTTSGIPCEIVPDGAGGWRFEQGPCGA